MKIHVLSDLHREFEPYLPSEVAVAEADVIVLAGDIDVGDRGVAWALQGFRGKPIIYVLGNHEYYSHVYPALGQELEALTNDTEVHVLENRARTIGDVTFHGATLWTDFNLFRNINRAVSECEKWVSDFRVITREPGKARFTPRDAAQTHEQSKQWLRQSLAASTTPYNVVVTHHSPSKTSVPSRFKTDIISTCFASSLDQLVEELAPDLWIHGHMHNSNDYWIGKTRVLCNPLGYPNELNPTFDPGLLIDLPGVSRDDQF